MITWDLHNGGIHSIQLLGMVTFIIIDENPCNLGYAKFSHICGQRGLPLPVRGHSLPPSPVFFPCLTHLQPQPPSRIMPHLPRTHVCTIAQFDDCML